MSDPEAPAACVVCRKELPLLKRAVLPSLSFFYGVKRPEIEAAVAGKKIDGVLVSCSHCGMIQQIVEKRTEELLHLVYQSEASGLSSAMTDSGWGKERAGAFFAETEFLHPPGSVLEVGCQDGYILREMVRRFNPKVAAGIEPGLKKIDTLNGKITFYGDFFENCPIEPESFDTILSLFVLEHLSDPRSFLDSIYKAMTPDGQLIISVPNAEDRFRDGDPGVFVHEHISYFSENSIHSLFKVAGFKVVRLRKTMNDFFVVAVKGTPANAESLSAGPDLLTDYQRKLNEIIRSFQKRVEGKKTIFWGACPTSANLLAILNLKNYEIVDGDSKKQNREFSGFEPVIHHPDWILSHQSDQNVVCIAPFGFRKPIEKTIREKYAIPYFHLFDLLPEQPEALHS